MLSLSQRQSLAQRLSPQQVQYLKMLQLPVIALEQRIKQELEANPMLEELSEIAQETEEFEPEQQLTLTEPRTETPEPQGEAPQEQTQTEESRDNDYEWEEFLNDDYEDPFKSSFGESDDEEQEEIPQRSEETLSEALIAQLRVQPMSEDELALAEEIIGNIDEHGYLRRDLAEIVDDLNKFIAATKQSAARLAARDNQLGDGHFDAYEELVAETPFGRERLVSSILNEYDEETPSARTDGDDDIPVDPFSVSFDDDDMPSSRTSNDRYRSNGHGTNGHGNGGSSESAAVSTMSPATLSIEEMSQLSIEDLAKMLEQGTSAPAMRLQESRAATDGADSGTLVGEVELEEFEPVFDLKEAERLLHRIQRLDPPGIGARDLRECLSVQLELQQDKSPMHKLALRVICDAYNEFTMKHFEKVCDRLKCTTEELKGAVEIIRTLNPKPGEGSVSIINDNYLTPDFVIERDTDDFIIVPNDRHVPSLRINRAYQELMRRGKAKKNGIDRDTRKFLREKFEAAKWFIASIQQRRQTMMKVMRAIVDLQSNFFNNGPSQIRPMIYKDVAERIGMDISTVCRVVNGKYVQTDYGTFELRYFFSEKLETTSGEEVSTKIVKAKIQEMIEAEDKNHPLSDDAISKEMKDAGFFVARRTVAKYREQMNIPVARLRRGLD